MVIVFFLVRFGPAAMHQQLEVCSGQDVRAIPFDENSTVAALQFTPHQESMFGGLIDLLYVRLWLQEAKNTMELARDKMEVFEQHSAKIHQSLLSITEDVNQCVENNSIIAEQAQVQATTSTELDRLLHQLHDEVSGQMNRSEQLVVCQTQLSDANQRLSHLIGSFKIS